MLFVLVVAYVFVCVTPAAYPPIRPLLFLLTASLPCFSYCCACSVIDSLARKAPPRIMWPLVKDFIASKVLRHTHNKVLASFHSHHHPAQAASADVFDRRGALAVLRSTAEGLMESMRPNAEGLVRACVAHGTVYPTYNICNS